MHYHSHGLGRPPTTLRSFDPGGVLMSPRPKKKLVSQSMIASTHPNTAGIDIGATELYVAVRPDRTPTPVRCFSSFTEDLIALADWLKSCQVTSVAMESTGVYWIPI